MWLANTADVCHTCPLFRTGATCWALTASLLSSLSASNGCCPACATVAESAQCTTMHVPQMVTYSYSYSWHLVNDTPFGAICVYIRRGVPGPRASAVLIASFCRNWLDPLRTGSQKCFLCHLARTAVVLLHGMHKLRHMPPQRLRHGSAVLCELLLLFAAVHLVTSRRPCIIQQHKIHTAQLVDNSGSTSCLALHPLLQCCTIHNLRLQATDTCCEAGHHHTY